MRSLLRALAGAAIFAALVFPARAQHLGDVSLSTVSQALAKTATCTGSAQAFPVQNLGQISHQATALSAAASFVMEIDGGDSIATTYRISNPPISFSNNGSVSYVAQGFGYYAVEQVVITCTPSATFSLSYSGGQTAFSSLIGPTGANVQPFNLSAAEVQGFIPPGGSTAGINPLLDGGIAPPINGGFTALGLDNASFSSTSIPGSFVGTQTMGSVPQTQQNGKELAVAFETLQQQGGTQTITLVAPWVAVPGITGCNSGGGVCLATIANANAGQIYQRSYQSGGVQNPSGDILGVLTFTATPTTTVRQGAFRNALSVPLAATLSNSTLAASLDCRVTCTGIGLTDSQGNIWKQVSVINLPGTNGGQQTLSLWVSTTPSSAASDTLTFTVASGGGTLVDSMAIELTNLTPSNLTAPATFAQVDPLGNFVTRLDAEAPNQFSCSVTLSTNTTTQLTGCGAPTTVNGVPVRLYITDVQVQTTTAGTATVVQLKTGTGVNCATGPANLSAINYADTTIGLQTFFGMRTPLVAPLQSAVCATQSGTTAGTVVVEVHAFLAP